MLVLFCGDSKGKINCIKYDLYVKERKRDISEFFHDEDTEESSLAGLQTTSICSLQTASQIKKKDTNEMIT